MTAPSEEVAVDRGDDVSPRRSRRTRAAWLISGAAVLLAGALTTTLTWPAHVDPGRAAAAPAVEAADATGRDDVWRRANAALTADDREAFLAVAVGDARAELAQWWDSTAALGRTTAVLTPWDDAYVYLGAALDHAPHLARGSGVDDAGLTQLQGSYYDTTWDGDQIATLSPTPSPAPWDETALTAVRADGVTLYAASDEAHLLEADLPIAQDASHRARQVISDLGATPTLDGFLVGLTDDDARMARWQFGDHGGWGMTVAGFALPALRPSTPEPWIPAEVATGDGSSGALLVLGPSSADQRLETYTHEFIHALHYAAAPHSEQPLEIAIDEGFAEWATARTGVTDDLFDDPMVRDAIATRGTAAYSDEAIRSADAWIAYAAAASYFAFVDATGGDAWRLAVDAARSGGTLADAAARLDPAYDAAAWQAWISSR